MLADSKLLDQLERNAFSTAGRPLCLHGAGLPRQGPFTRTIQACCIESTARGH